MLLFDEAFDAMWDHDAIQAAFACARRYFSGEQTAKPVWEIMSDKPAKAVKDITSILHGE